LLRPLLRQRQRIDVGFWAADKTTPKTMSYEKTGKGRAFPGLFDFPMRLIIAALW
jgi:hypothetical protein